MNRNFYYLIVLFMLMNTVIYIPRMLIESRYHGAITAILIVIPFGSMLAFLFYKGMKNFHGMGIPEIFKQYLPLYLRSPFVIVLGIMWFAAGSLAIVVFSNILIKFLNPHVSLSNMVLFFVLIGGWTATFSSTAILFVLEMILIAAIPLQLFIYYKAFRNETFDWTAVFTMSDYVLGLPSWNTLSAAAFLFSGYLSLSLFNRIFAWKTPLSFFWMIPVTGTIIGLTTFFIPIGIHGTQAVNEYLDIWVNTADSLRMDYGLIERVLFVFLFLYMGLTLIFITICWHVGMELVRSVFPKQNEYINWIIVAIIGIGTLLFSHFSTEKQLYHFVQQWLNLRLVMELLLVTIISVLGWRKKHA